MTPSLAKDAKDVLAGEDRRAPLRIDCAELAILDRRLRGDHGIECLTGATAGLHEIQDQFAQSRIGDVLGRRAANAVAQMDATRRHRRTG